MAKIILGAEYHKRLRYKNPDGVLTDPDSIVALLRRHSDTSGGGNVTITKDATGVYDVIATPDTAGVWWLEVTATGAGVFVDRVDEFSFVVTESSVA